MTGNLLFNTLFHPSKVFVDLSQENDATVAIIPRYSLLILLLPPIFSWLGSTQLGWRVGGSEPVFFDTTGSIVFSFFYFIILCIGFFGTVVISKWMATTYEAKVSASLHLSIFTVICAPLVAASIAHLYPDVFFNVLVLVPALIWSVRLLYKGLPVALGISLDQGMLMASSLVGWLLVAAVSLLGICVSLWTNGARALLGI
jgi:hypothetical protein